MPREPRRRIFIDLTPLRESRDLRWLLGGQLVSLLGNQLTAVAIPYQVYVLTHSSLDVGPGWSVRSRSPPLGPWSRC